VSLPRVQEVTLLRDDAYPHSEEIAVLARRASNVCLFDEGLPYRVNEVISAQTRTLTIAGEVPTEEFVAVKDAPNLRELNCFNFALSETALRAVLEHPRLEDASVAANTDDLADLQVAGRSNLQTLEVEFYVPTSKSDGEYGWLGGCPRLKTIECTEPDPQFLVQVGRRLGGVSRLTLNGDGQASIDSLSQWRRLRHLSFYLCDTDDQLLLRISQILPDLESLEIFGWAGMFTPDGFRSLKQLPRLRRLGLERCELTKEHVAVLATLSQVEELSLYDNPLDDTAVAPLGKLPRLKLLDLDGTEVSSGAFPGIRGGFKPRWSGF
jgi:hypothetical protein